jgi:hypothetical protein
MNKRAVMKNLGIMILLVLILPVACTNKRLENNIKSLEKRVAELERKIGPVAPANTIPSNASNATRADGPLPVINFSQTDFDFGTIDEGDVVEHVFEFTNSGKAPLVIQKATATCGCTVPQWPREPIPVGGNGEIRVKFDSKNRQNLQTKYVTITANTQPEQTRLKISGRVLAKKSNSDS